jgi:hypothetical protein
MKIDIFLISGFAVALILLVTSWILQRYFIKHITSVFTIDGSDTTRSKRLTYMTQKRFQLVHLLVVIVAIFVFIATNMWIENKILLQLLGVGPLCFEMIFVAGIFTKSLKMI